MQQRSLSLVQEKISELRTALLFCENPYDLPYASYLIEVDGMDDQGCISFCINNQNGQSVTDNAAFPVRLEFYRKGIPYTIDVKGMATLETSYQASTIFVKVRIGQLRYTELIVPAMQPLEAFGKIVKSIFDIPGPLDDYAGEQ